MQSAMMYYSEHIDALSQISNKRTMFLSHLIFRSEWNKEIGLNVVIIAPIVKREIVKEVCGDVKNPINTADQNLRALEKAGLIKNLKGGGYALNPKHFGFAKYVNKEARNKAFKIYEERVFLGDGTQKRKAYFYTDSGDLIDIEDSESVE